MKDIEEWLSKPPKYTTFRVNTLKKIDNEVLQTYLHTVSYYHNNVLRQF